MTQLGTIPGPSTTAPSLKSQAAPVSEHEIARGLKPGASPLDFIKKNLRPAPGAEAPTTAERILNEVQEKRANEQSNRDTEAERRGETSAPNAGDRTPAREDDIPAAKDSSGDGTGSEDFDRAFSGDGDGAGEPSKVEGDVRTDSEAVSVSEEELGVDDKPVAENFKKLRTKLRETLKTKKETETKLQTLESELGKFQNGEAVAPILQEKETRIAELERYEQIHNLKNSKAYRENFVQPLNEVTGKLSEIALDYGIPKDVINKALNMGNEAQLNQFLSQHFDTVGAVEVKSLINTARTINAQAQEAEKEPARMLAELNQQHAIIENERQTRRKETIVHQAKSSWTDTLISMRNEGKFPELTLRTGDEKHNKLVTPIIAKASTEYGKLVRKLTDAGVEQLPPEVASYLARMTLISHAAAIAINTRNSALDKLSEVTENVKRHTSHIRPSIGGASVSAPRPVAPAPQKLETKVDGLLDSVLSKRRA